MFQCGDRVLYGMHGVCEIVHIETQKINGKATEYYVLQPIEGSDSKYYVPTQNEKAVAKMRPILTEEQLHAMLHSADMQHDAWIEDSNQRKQHYSSSIASGDRAALVRMVHAIHKHKEELSAAGKRLHLCDENFLRDAQRILTTEIAMVMGIPADQVDGFLHSSLE